VTLRAAGPIAEVQMQIRPGFLSPALALVAPQEAPADALEEQKKPSAVDVLRGTLGR